MLPYRYNRERTYMNNLDYTYDEYVEDDKEYKEIEDLLEKYNIKPEIKKYIEDKYMDTSIYYE